MRHRLVPKYRLWGPPLSLRERNYATAKKLKEKQNRRLTSAPPTISQPLRLHHHVENPTTMSSTISKSKHSKPSHKSTCYLIVIPNTNWSHFLSLFIEFRISINALHHCFFNSKSRQTISDFSVQLRLYWTVTTTNSCFI